GRPGCPGNGSRDPARYIRRSRRLPKRQRALLRPRYHNTPGTGRCQLMNAKKTNLTPQQENEFFEDVEENLMENILQEERNILETETKSAAESADPVCYRRAPIRTWFCTFMIMN